MTKSQLEEAFALQLRAAGLPRPEREYRFAREVVGDAPGLRKRLRAAGLKDWRFDFAWTPQRVAVEVQGGTWSGRGKHVRGTGYENDCRKACAAVILGWRLLSVTGRMIDDGTALAAVEQVLGCEKI